MSICGNGENMGFEGQINVLRNDKCLEGKGLYPEMCWNVSAAG